MYVHEITGLSHNLAIRNETYFHRNQDWVLNLDRMTMIGYQQKHYFLQLTDTQDFADFTKSSVSSW